MFSGECGAGPQEGQATKAQGNTGNTWRSVATCLGMSRPHVTTHHLRADQGNRSSEVRLRSMLILCTCRLTATSLHRSFLTQP